MTGPPAASDAVASTLGEAILLAQHRYLQGEDARAAFQCLLDGLLGATQSEYGFIGEVERDGEGAPYLRTRAITNIAWTQPMRELVERSSEEGMRFRRLDTLYGAVMTTRAPVIANAPSADPRTGGLPHGHPPMHAFLGLPFSFGDEMVGMVGVANRQGGYDLEICEVLAPLLATCGTLIASWRSARARREVERALAESERRFREIAEHIEEVFWVSSTDKNTIDYVSPAFERIWQIPAETLKARPRAWLDAVHPDDRGRVLEAAISRQVTGVYDERYRLLLPGGEVRWIHDRAKPVRDERGAVLRIIGTARDVTAEMQAAERERRALEQLRGLARHLGEAEARVRRDVAHVLHDDIQQQLAAAKLRLDVPPESTRAQAMEAISGAQRMIEACIAATRTLAHQVRPPILRARRVDLALTWLAEWAHAAHGLKVEVSCPELEVVSSVTLEVLIFSARELLFNVAKHAGVNAARLSAALSDGKLEIVVEDRGRGLPPGGTESGGLGLPGVRERLLALSGELDVEGVAGGGVRARMWLPIETGLAVQPMTSVGTLTPTGATSQGRRTRIRVLIVDDHALIREGLALRLRTDREIEIVGEAADGLEALEAVARLQPDVVLMDVSMPRMGGLEATRQIHARLPAVKIIGLSMHDPSEMAQAMIGAGAVRYVNKGDADEIVQVIKDEVVIR